MSRQFYIYTSIGESGRSGSSLTFYDPVEGPFASLATAKKRALKHWRQSGEVFSVYERRGDTENRKGYVNRQGIWRAY